VSGEAFVVGIDVSFISSTLNDSAFEVVRNQKARNPAEGFKHHHVGMDKVGFFLRRNRKYKRTLISRTFISSITCPFMPKIVKLSINRNLNFNADITPI
jgi:hypothetical protein